MEKRPKLPSITEIYVELYNLVMDRIKDKIAKLAISRVSDPSKTGHVPNRPNDGGIDWKSGK
ncbi:MAG: hypothetical protein QG645_433 [Patescibacteria group bacterium]|nr:hypothetical protein [Patescibacteria group bacterium]